jgi:RecJ-like exonuclease
MGIGELYEFEKTGRIDPEPSIRKIEEICCPHCQGKGKIKHCPECRGRGQISKSNGTSMWIEPCPNGCQRPIATFSESK